MAHNSLAYFYSVINSQARAHDVLSEYLTQAETLAHVAASCKEFAGLGDEVINNYAWTISEILYKANKLNDRLSNKLAEIRGSNVRDEFFKPESIKNDDALTFILDNTELKKLSKIIKQQFISYAKGSPAPHYHTFSNAVCTVASLGYAAIITRGHITCCALYQNDWNAFLRYFIYGNIVPYIGIIATSLAQMINVAVTNFCLIGYSSYFNDFRNALITILGAWNSTDEETNRLLLKLTLF